MSLRSQSSQGLVMTVLLHYAISGLMITEKIPGKMQLKSMWYQITLRRTIPRPKESLKLSLNG